MLIFLVLDTTGREIYQDVICSCGIIAEEKPFFELINEGKKVPPKASAYHHITTEMLCDAPKFLESESFYLLQEYNKKENILFVHDAPFVEGMLLSHGFSFGGTIIDTQRVAKHCINDCDTYSLRVLRYELLLYKKEPENLPCNAFADVHTLALLYEYLLSLCPLTEMQRLTNTQVLLQKIPFGKYEGRYIEEIVDVDRKYLQWMLGLEDLDEDLRYSLKYYLQGTL